MPLLTVRTEARGIFARSSAVRVSACLTAPVTWTAGGASCAARTAAARSPQTHTRRVYMTTSHCATDGWGVPRINNSLGGSAPPAGKLDRQTLRLDSTTRRQADLIIGRYTSR